MTHLQQALAKLRAAHAPFEHTLPLGQSLGLLQRALGTATQAVPDSVTRQREPAAQSRSASHGGLHTRNKQT